MPANPRAYDTRCYTPRDLGRGIEIACNVPVETSTHHVHRGRLGNGLAFSWDNARQCTTTDEHGWRCQLTPGHGTYHRATTLSGKHHNFATPAEQYVADAVSKSYVDGLMSKALNPPCLERLSLLPGSYVTCELALGHAAPHIFRYGSYAHTWGDTNQCPMGSPNLRLRCLLGGTHSGPHRSVRLLDAQPVTWQQGWTVELIGQYAGDPQQPKDTPEYRQHVIYGRVPDSGYFEVLQARGQLDQPPAARTYAQRKKGRR